GVDAVLNSLGGEFIPKSLETLAPFGRFLELGIRDIHNNTQLGLRPFEKGLTYSFISAGPDTPGFQSVFAEIVRHFNEGHFSALPLRVFSATEAASAFNYMARARHTGKVVVSLQDKEAIGVRQIEAVSNEIGPRGRKPPDSDLVRQQLKDGLSPAEGIDVFCRILGSAAPVEA
ncbi:MAG: zinc-binding dehydrogenase, partial [Gammaproteobacteria bacterium]|nr:zinc-binding dehydrogenase [Gammaproteobacteria bacterium]